jgi:uncharacterized membrane protein
MSQPEPENPDMADLIAEIAELEQYADSPAEREQLEETLAVARTVDRGVFGRVVSGFDLNDAAQAFFGGFIFGLPMLVEGGTQEVGAYLARHPVYYGGTLAAGIAMVIGVLYVADIQDVQIREPIFGLIPRKLLGVLVVSAATAVVTMTAWGRVDWGTPDTAVAQIAVAFVPMAIGASLGDILPGD